MKGGKDVPNTEVMAGAGLRVCPRCSSLFGRKFCGVCGERMEWYGQHWAALRIDVASRSGVAKQETWKVYPGEWESASGGVRLWIDGPDHLAWVRDRLQRGSLERYASLEGPSGRRISPDDPVFRCAVRVLDSQIRGCMTQRFRSPVCGEESTLLPLSEPRRTLSLCDLLDHYENHAAAQRLLAGVLWERSQRKEKVYCPLFGRALRISAKDADDLPGRMTDLVAARREGPLVLPVKGAPHRSNAKASQDTTAMQKVTGWSGSAVPAWVCPVPGGPVAVGAGGGGHCLVLGTESGEGLELPGNSRVHRAEGVLVVQYANPQGLWVTALVTDAAAPLSDAIHLSPGASDVDVRGDKAVALVTQKGRLQLVWVHRGGRPGVSTWGYSVGALPSTGWRIHILTDDAVLLWNQSGALGLLKPEGGWLLSPVASTSARLREPKESLLDLVGVVSAVPQDRGEFLVLSSLGHRVTKLTLDRSVKWPDAPVRIVQDAVLPFSAQRMTGRPGTRLFLEDSFGGMELSPVTLEPLGALPGQPGRSVMAVEGGGFSIRVPNGLELVQVGTHSNDSWFAKPLADAVARPPAAAEHPSVADRYGYLPHKVTWGG